MVGTKSSGNRFSFTVNPDASLGVFIERLAGEDQQGLGTWVINLILRTYAKEAEEFFKNHPNMLKEYKEKYAKTIIQQSIENAKRKKKAEARRKEIEDAKIKTANAYAKQTETAKESLDDSRVTMWCFECGKPIKENDVITVGDKKQPNRIFVEGKGFKHIKCPEEKVKLNENNQ